MPLVALKKKTNHSIQCLKNMCIISTNLGTTTLHDFLYLYFGIHILGDLYIHRPWIVFK